MKTGLDMVKEAYRLLNVAEFTSAITGGVYPLKRPENSQLEDVVIGALAINAAQFQSGIFNVNIHVPNLVVKIKGKPDVTMPDTAKLLGIANLVSDKLNDYHGYDFHFYIDQPAKPFQDTDGSWYGNIRVNYRSFQNNFKI